MDYNRMHLQDSEGRANMAGSSLVKKLGIKPGQKPLILNAPEGYMLGALPQGVEVKTNAQGVFDFVQAFVRSKADVEGQAHTAIQALKPGGLLWLAYPKKSSKIKTDISRDAGWEPVRRAGMEGVSLIAIDDTWSAMRFRRADDVKSRKKA
jgi:hypothetical protein